MARCSEASGSSLMAQLAFEQEGVVSLLVSSC